MNVKFFAEIQKLRPHLRYASLFLYAAPVGDVMCGFVHERMRYAGSQVTKYALPLYDNVKFLHLGFSERLQYWDGTKLSPKQEAARLVDCIAPHEKETYSWADPANFLKLAERKAGLENPWYRRGAAMTHIILGNVKSARKHLQILIEDSWIDSVPGFREDIALVNAELARGIEHARHLLMKWQKQTKDRFQLV